MLLTDELFEAFITDWRVVVERGMRAEALRQEAEIRAAWESSDSVPEFVAWVQRRSQADAIALSARKLSLSDDEVQ